MQDGKVRYEIEREDLWLMFDLKIIIRNESFRVGWLAKKCAAVRSMYINLLIFLFSKEALQYTVNHNHNFRPDKMKQ